MVRIILIKENFMLPFTCFGKFQFSYETTVNIALITMSLQSLLFWEVGGKVICRA